MKIRAVVKLPGLKAAVTNVDDDLESLRRLVGGTLASAVIGEECVVICNRGAKEQGLKKNMKLLGKTFYGPVVVLARDGEDFAGLTETEAETVRKWILNR